MIHGNFRIWLPRKAGEIILPPEPDIILPNRVTDEGEQAYLKMLFRDDTEVAGGADFYVGLCNQTPNETDVLTDISTEPDDSAYGFGYAREPISRDLAGWPTLTTVNGHTVMRSETIEFTAYGGDFSEAFTRAFMTSASTGTSGVLYSYSGALVEELLIENGDTFSMQYEVYFD